MFRTLIKKYLFEGDVVPKSDLIQVQFELAAKQIEIAELKKQILFQQATHKDIPIYGFDSLEVEPTKTKDRAQYIADVTLFFDNIFHNKLKVSIAEVRELLSNIGRQEGTPLSMSRVEYDYFLRGMEAMCWKIRDWALTLDAESKQGLQDNENNN